MPNESRLVRAITEVAAAAPDRVAIKFEGSSITYAQFVAEVVEIASRLSESGVRPGDRVGIMLPNRPETQIAWFATWWLGAVVQPVNYLYREDEVGYDDGPSKVHRWAIVKRVVGAAKRGAQDDRS